MPFSVSPETNSSVERASGSANLKEMAAPEGGYSIVTAQVLGPEKPACVALKVIYCRIKA
jgi:hypothetical protein